MEQLNNDRYMSYESVGDGPLPIRYVRSGSGS